MEREECVEEGIVLQDRMVDCRVEESLEGSSSSFSIIRQDCEDGTQG